jgi:hypothetical protein
MVFLGPRIAGLFWWLIRPLYWQGGFAGWPIVWWIWPILGLIFIPWTTLMYIIVYTGGVVGFDWVWLGLALAADIFSYGGGAYKRKSVPYYPSSAP